MISAAISILLMLANAAAGFWLGRVTKKINHYEPGNN